MIRAAFLATLVLLALSACGQKGPLRLPDPSAPPPAAKP